MPTAILIAIVSFTVILTASWWLMGSTAPGILLFIVGVAVWLIGAVLFSAKVHLMPTVANFIAAMAVTSR
jgi:hypothetical protein